MTSIQTSQYLRQQKISSHCWSPDRQFIAMALMNGLVEVYTVGETPENVDSWVKTHTFKDASMTVSVVDWSVLNNILTGSYDRSSFVYRERDGKWQKELVVQWNDKAVLCGEWSPNGQKFVLGTSCHSTMVGYFEKENNWWFAQLRPSFHSSVVTAKFHPSGRVVLVGSTDYKVKVITAVIQDNKNRKPLMEFEDPNYKGVFGAVETFGDELFQVDLMGWINCVDFSPSGMKLIAYSHVGQILQIPIDEQGIFQYDNRQETTFSQYRPLLQVKYVDDDIAVGVGFDRKPIKYQVKNELSVTGYVIDRQKSGPQQGGVQQKAQLFQSKQVNAPSKKTLDEIGAYDHQTQITCIQRITGNLFSTTDTNGTFKIWKI